MNWPIPRSYPSPEVIAAAQRTREDFHALLSLAQRLIDAQPSPRSKAAAARRIAQAVTKLATEQGANQ